MCIYIYNHIYIIYIYKNTSMCVQYIHIHVTLHYMMKLVWKQNKCVCAVSCFTRRRLEWAVSRRAGAKSK